MPGQIEKLQLRNAELERALAAKNRELEIEAALQCVRAVAMSMKEPAAMLDVCKTIAQQLLLLHIKDIRNVQTAIVQESKGTYINYEYYVRHDKQLTTEVSYTDHPMTAAFVSQMLKGTGEIFQHSLSGNELKDWYAHQQTTNQFVDSFLEQAESLNYYWFSLGAVALGISTYEPLKEEELTLFIRFRNVFELTYSRYLDIEKAETQAREAQIQLALERVRARAMAMQTSEELNELIGTVFIELTKLDLILTRCVIMIFDSSTNGVHWWMANSEAPSEPMSFYVKYLDLPFFNAYLKGWQERTVKWTFTLDGKAKIETDDVLFKETELSLLPDFVIAGMRTPGKVYLNASFNNFGNLTLASLEQLASEHFDILLRFAKVFDQTYTRFNDIKQAETQAREAQIEAALEKVRGKAMAMRNSNDLSSAASIVFTELRKLGIRPIRCGVGLLTKDSRKALLYSATSSPHGDSLSLVGWVMLSRHPVLEKIYETWLTNEDYFPELQGEQLRYYYELLLAGLSVKVPDWQSGQKQYGHFLTFSVGCLYAWSEIPYIDAEIKILKRFAIIIDLTFRRYLELQKAEASAKEALRQASVDRVRAEIASMRTTKDLDRIIPLIWNELTTLNIPFIRCGVFIFNEAIQQTNVYLSTPDGQAIAAFQLPFESKGFNQKMLQHWRNNKIFIDHWDAAAFTAWTHSLVEADVIRPDERYSNEKPPENQYLHFAPFAQGMLYVGDTASLSEEALQLVQSLADAFASAYARYEDFKKLEMAKQQIETTLSNLKSAQAQLIQSEKMASLGELTAGIAHEIQNPLNFVNNFSEVNQELLLGIKGEIEKGDFAEVKLLVDDILSNEEKINHHGKRADSIVKGMLQHSRTSSGKKEPTDINALCEEFLRLSFHGLRAKDKSFNSKIETKFDESIGKVDAVPQEIGRVLLNLFNNAFYAVHEKKNTLDESYEPIVVVSTKKLTSKIEIRVQDNGMGISKSLQEKIFQPFFTTKPTGQGTGLGLSLSYDIVKAHGGNLKVESNENEGAAFVIQLPTNSHT